MATASRAARDAERVATAWHEAGHVTAYLTHGLTVRYATLRPRKADAIGFTAVPRRIIPAWDVAVIAHAGPTAQGMHEWRTRGADADEGLDESDYVFSAYLAGGGCDAAAAAVAPQMTGPEGGDFWEWSARKMLELHWPVVAAIAESLLAHSTVSGVALRDVALTAAAAADIPDTFYLLRSDRR